VRSPAARQVGLLAHRSITRTLRDPGNVAPGIVVPLLHLAALFVAFGAAARLALRRFA